MQMQNYLRYLLIAGMAATAYMMVLAWQKDYGNAATSQSQPAQQQHSQAQNTQAQSTQAQANTPTPAMQTASADVPNAAQGAATSTGDVPPAATAAVPQTTGNDVPSAQNQAVPVAKNLINVTTDKYFLQIDPVGGDIIRTDLLDYKEKLNGKKAMTLFENDKRVYVAQSGLQGVNGIDTAAGRATFTSRSKNYQMQKGKDLVVPLTFTDKNGVTITKSYTFKSGEYPITMTYHVNNATAQPWQANLYAQLKRDGSSDPGQENRGFMSMATYLGGAWGTPDEPYNKIKFSDFGDADDKLDQNTKAGWVAMVQHYFVGSWIPAKDYSTNLFSFENAGNHFIGFNSAPFTVAPNTQKSISATLYAGPKIQKELKSLATGLNQTVDFGFLWPVAQLLYNILNKVHDVLGNWGWSIIVLTILVKLAFLWLSNKSYRSMGKMRVLAPKMQALKDKHGDDRMAMSQDMMKLYKEEQVNPMSGCLPILVQMPIFIALYWVLVESVELRHAPWIGWIQDLSHMDPWFILPILMGATMYVSQMLNPQPTDPMQAKVFKILPVLFTTFMLFFPAGLVLYWTVNNLFTVGQQTYINRQIEKEQAAKAAS